MHRLRRLDLSGNPVDKITNDSFLGLQHLEHLDISGIEAESFQVGGTRKSMKQLYLISNHIHSMFLTHYRVSESI